MIGFLISAGAMALMVAIGLVHALRHASGQPAPARTQDLVVYRDQLNEVDRDLARGVIPTEEAGRLRTEVQRRMLEADRASSPTSAPTAPVGPGLAAALVVVALLGSGVIYYAIGAPGYPDLPIAGRLASAAADYKNRPHQEELEAKAKPFAPAANTDKASLDLMEKLRATVAARPDDLQGQSLLAQNEYALGNFIGARKAMDAVIRLKGADATAQDYGMLAELMINAAGGIITPEAEAALNDTLKRDPKNGAARFYMGLMAAQVGRPDRAFATWKPLLDEGPQGAVWIEPIRSMIQGVADAAGVQYEAPAAKGPSAGDMANAAQMTPEDRQKMIEGMVGGLEGRLMESGGPVDDWTKLINALGVLGAKDRAKAAYAKAQVAFEGQPGELSALKAAAVQAGVSE
ncbi:MAG: c-type cytochrome biogenesis protein CcmI [Cypionkella sp.]